MAQAQAQKARAKATSRDAEDDAVAEAPASLESAAVTDATAGVVSKIDEALEGEELAEELRFAQAKADWAGAYSDEAKEAWEQRYGAAYRVAENSCHSVIARR